MVVFFFFVMGLRKHVDENITWNFVNMASRDVSLKRISRAPRLGFYSGSRLNLINLPTNFKTANDMTSAQPSPHPSLAFCGKVEPPLCVCSKGRVQNIPTFRERLSWEFLGTCNWFMHQIKKTWQ